MRTINISISDLEYDRLGIKTDNLTFSDLVDLVSKELSKQTLNKSIELAERLGLSDLTLKDISDEVKAVRRNAKNNN